MNRTTRRASKAPPDPSWSVIIHLPQASVGLEIHPSFDDVPAHEATFILTTGAVAVALDGERTGQLPGSTLTRDRILSTIDLLPGVLRWTRNGSDRVVEVARGVRVVFTGDRRFWGELIARVVYGLKDGTIEPTRGWEGGSYDMALRSLPVRLRAPP